MSEIFISYRRSDSADVSGRIYDYLEAEFGHEHVFKDVDSIPFGVNFKQTLENAIQHSVVVLVVIGKNWLNAAGDDGRRRLENPDDFVTLEIKLALTYAVPIIPLLVSGAEMPLPEQLPPSIEKLAHFHGTSVRPDPDFRCDIQRVIARICNLLETTQDTRSLEVSAFPSKKVESINNYLQARLKQEGLATVTAVEAGKWLDEVGLLNDSSTRPGKPLRELLRRQLIWGQRQESNQRWYIDRMR